MAQLFHQAGADMGDPGTFYRADRHNPDGYFEQPDIHDINFPLIHGPWGRLAYFWLPNESTIRRRGRRMQSQIQHVAAKYRDKVVKETRFCLTLPAWLEAGTAVEGILVCLREPQAVAQSLRKRNKATLRHGLNLWQTHNQRLLASAGQIPLRFISFARLLDPRYFEEEVRSAFNFFQIEVPPEQIRELGENVVKPDWNHARAETPNYPPAVAALWDELSRRHAAQSSSDRPTVDRQPCS